ncbi:hypothetical protein LJC10_00725 [Selenomonadales bacterium OttesenSCG-928-I06]|nr:hypothetical protein [Selenomonadales bacterium OttesenSCG-928-I06]
MADISNAWDEARNVIKELDIKRLPINPFEVASNLNIILEPYSIFECYTPNIIKKLRDKKCEAITSKDIGTGEYHVLFDDVSIRADRLNFTIAHEIGHIRLGHCEKFYNNYTCLEDFIHKNYSEEKDADNFAAELLRSPFLLILIGAKNFYDIQDICDVSYKASLVGERQIRTILPAYNIPRYVSVFKFYIDQFSDFIHERYCENCGYKFIGKTIKTCIMCGSESIPYHINKGYIQTLEYHKRTTMVNTKTS